LLDTHVYEDTHPDGHSDSYAAYIITQNISSKVDPEGYFYQLLDDLINRHKDSTTMPLHDQWVMYGNNKTMRMDTMGWQLQVKWKDLTIIRWVLYGGLKSSGAALRSALPGTLQDMSCLPCRSRFMDGKGLKI